MVLYSSTPGWIHWLQEPAGDRVKPRLDGSKRDCNCEGQVQGTGSLVSFMTNDQSILLDVVLKPELKECLSLHFKVVSSWSYVYLRVACKRWERISNTNSAAVAVSCKCTPHSSTTVPAYGTTLKETSKVKEGLSNSLLGSVFVPVSHPSHFPQTMSFIRNVHSKLMGGKSHATTALGLIINSFW